MTSDPGRMTCESCGEEYPADPETVALVEAEDWRATYCPSVGPCNSLAPTAAT